MIRLLRYVQSVLTLAAGLSAIAIALILVVYFTERGKVYFRVDSRLTNVDNLKTAACTNFDPAYYNILISSELRAAAATSSQVLTDSSDTLFLRETDPTDALQESIALLADQNYISQLMLRSRLFANEVRPIILYFQLDDDCQVSHVMLVHQDGTRTIGFDRKATHAGLARDIMRTLSEYHDLRAKVSTDPDGVRGRALARVFEGTDRPRFLNLIGITYLVDSNSQSETMAQERMLREAIVWFEAALDDDAEFQPAILNLAKARARLSRHSLDTYKRQVAELLRNYYRASRKGYLDVASSLLVDIVRAGVHRPGIHKRRAELEQARHLAEAEVRRFGGSCALFMRLAEIYNYLAIVESSTEHRRKSVNYAYAARSEGSEYLCDASDYIMHQDVYLVQ